MTFLIILVGIAIIFYLAMLIAAAVTDAPVYLPIILAITIFLLCAYFYTLVWVM